MKNSLKKLRRKKKIPLRCFEGFFALMTCLLHILSSPTVYQMLDSPMLSLRITDTVATIIDCCNIIFEDLT